MREVCVLGLGQMGMGMARNLIAAGLRTKGYDPQPGRRVEFERLGGIPAGSCAAAADGAEAAFVMVMDGDQARRALLAENAAADSLAAGSTVIVTATIQPSEVRALEGPLAESGIDMLDSPVTGGRSGAEEGTLTLMTAGKAAVLERNRPALGAISNHVFHVGEQIGQGQMTKAALQAFIGCLFAGTFEALVLGAKGGVEGRVLFDVIRSSAAGSPLFETTARNVLDRNFQGTGSHIRTMHKDLGICASLGRETGTPLFATGAAHRMFQAGISRHPDCDNWVVAKWLEALAGTEVSW